jgi:hypothetical protein
LAAKSLSNYTGYVSFGGLRGISVARIYAGVLALIAMLTTLCHGLLRAADTDEILFRTWWVMWLFAGIGYVLGAAAERMVDESVQTQLAAEAAAEQQTDGLTTSPGTAAGR